MTTRNHIFEWQHECFGNTLVAFTLRYDEPLVGLPVNTISFMTIPTGQVRPCERSHNDVNDGSNTLFVSNGEQCAAINVLIVNMDKALNANCDNSHKDIKDNGQVCRSLETVLLMTMILPIMNLIIKSLFYCNSYHKKSYSLKKDIFTETSLRVAA